MEFVKKKCDHPIIRRKRLLDDVNDRNDRDLEKLRKHKRMVQAVRDFPPGCGPCGIFKEAADRKPLKNLRNVHSNLENNKPKPSGKVKFWDPTCSNNEGALKPKVTTTVVTVRKPLDARVKEISVNSQSFERDKLKSKSIEQAEFRRNKPLFRSKPAAKVKFWDPLNEGHDQEPKVTTTIVSRGKLPLKSSENVKSNVRKLTSNGDQDKRSGSKEVTATIISRKENSKREKIKEAMSVFDQVYTELLQENRLKIKGEKIAHWRVPVEAVKLAKQMLKWMDPVKSLGPICGVEIGDAFKYRSQLKMIGLHCQLQSGIDYTNIEGKNLAISIVDSHRYSNETGSSDVLIYCGHGGLGFLGHKLPPEDQKLERGNLALKNSMEEKTTIRVIKKVERFEKNEVFVYDGLYVANHYTQERNEEGKIMFKFRLNRVPGQPALHQMLNVCC